MAQRSRANANPKPYEICGAINQSGFPCGNKAGHGTNHIGVGRCKFHGGEQQTLKSITKKEGLAAAINFPGIQEEFDRLQKNEDVFNLRDHIHLIEAIALTVIKNAKTVDDLPMVAKLVRDAAKTVKELDEIEHGRRLVIELPELRIFLDQIKTIIFRHIPDNHTRSLISTDLLALPIAGTGSTDQSSPEHSISESGLAVEDGLRLREKV